MTDLVERVCTPLHNSSISPKGAFFRRKIAGDDEDGADSFRDRIKPEHDDYMLLLFFDVDCWFNVQYVMVFKSLTSNEAIIYATVASIYDHTPCDVVIIILK